MEDLRKMRSINTSNGHLNPHGKSPMYGHYAANNQLHKAQSGHMYIQQPSASTHHGDASLAAVSQGFHGMSLQSPAFAHSTRPSPQMSTRSSEYGGVPIGSMTNGVPNGYIVNGQIVWTGGSHLSQAAPGYNTQLTASPGMYQGAQYYNNWQHGHIDHSPQNTSYQSSRVASSEVPSLITPRRGSSSSNENDVPGTPFTQYTGYGGVAIADHSPHSVFAWSTPSPTAGFTGKPAAPQEIPVEIQLILQQEPKIPPPVPAPSSPAKTLDRALQNPKGITNVYIRGLQQNTTDEDLAEWASRFGEIVSCKSIIDHNTNKCKGFGFVKYHNFKDAEKCIRGFYYMGYESSFARESFYAVLKKLSDEKNTNLYVSNLPKNMNEHELSTLFGPYKVASSRILRNPDGSGRGVGFARFETRDICDKVIKEYNNTPVAKPDSEEHLMQIRFADTKEQKALKQQTTAARNFRSSEYEAVTQGRLPFYDPARMQSVPANGQMYEHDFESYMTNVSGPPRPGPYSPNMLGRFATSDDRPGTNSHPSHVSSSSERTVINTTYPAAQPVAAVSDDIKTKSVTTTPTKSSKASSE